MNSKKNIGICSLCGRDMFEGPSINEHHLVPKSFKGKEKIFLHKACHQKIHSIFTEKELQKKFNTIALIKTNSEIKNL
jgi:5-methylcytosine-specific restriction endonuclease McrA